MSLATKILVDDIVYWAPTSRYNAYGSRILADPVEIKGRWEDNQELTVNVKGETVVSTSQIYADRILKVGGFLWLGSLVDAPETPRGDDGSVEILSFSLIQNRRHTKIVRIARV